MHTIPELYGRTNFLVEVNQGQIDACLQHCVFRDFPCDKDVFNLCLQYMTDNGRLQPETPESALDLYLLLRNYIHREFDNWLT